MRIKGRLSALCDDRPKVQEQVCRHAVHLISLMLWGGVFLCLLSLFVFGGCVLALFN